MFEQTNNQLNSLCPPPPTRLTMKYISLDKENYWQLKRDDTCKETWASKHQTTKDLFGGTSPLQRHNSTEDKDLKWASPEKESSFSTLSCGLIGDTLP